MRFRVLGPVSFRTPQGWRTPRGRLRVTLLASLLAARGEYVSTDRLVESLWGAEPDQATSGRLQLQVHRLRADLGEDARIEHHDGRYRLHLAPGDLDSVVFDDLATRILRDGLPGAERLALAEQALELWQGTPFGGVSAEACATEAAYLESRRLGVLEARFESGLQLGRHAAMLDELERVAAENPVHEGLQLLLVQALDRAGRRSDALAAFRRTRARLVDELGVEPGPALTAAHQRVLLGEGTPAPQQRVPAQLPPTGGDLSGRDAALEVLDALADGPTEVVVLCGPAGVGKTALALTWAAARRDSYPDGQLYADLRGFGGGEPLTPYAVLTTFLDVLGEAPTGERSLEELTARFRSAVAGRRLLVVLDNALSVEQVLPLLPGPGGSFTVVTSRVSLTGLAVQAGAELMGVAPLTDEGARDLLAERLGRRVRDDTAVDALVRHCAHLPLALRIASEQLLQRPDAAVADFVDEIADEELRLDALDLGEDTSSVRAVLQWSYERLAPDEQRVLHALGTFPGRTPGVSELAALSGLAVRETRRALQGLERAHLVERRGSDWTQHDLLRTFSAELAQRVVSDADVRAAQQRLLASYAATSLILRALFRPDPVTWRVDLPGVADAPVPELPDAAAARAWMDRHGDDLVACADRAVQRRDLTADEAELVAMLWRTASGVFTSLGGAAAAVPLAEAGLRACRQLGDREGELRARILRGAGLTERQGVAAGFAELEAVVAEAEQASMADVAAVARLNLGASYAYHDRYEEALEQYQLVHAWAAGAEDEYVDTMSRSNLASASLQLGRPEDALRWAAEAEEMAVRAGDARVEAFVLMLQGEAALQLGRLEDAERLADAAVRVARDAGIGFREADALRVVGMVALGRDRPVAAFEAFQASIRIARELPGRANTVYDALVGCARARAASGRTDALSYVDEASALARRFGLLDRRDEVLAEVEKALAAARPLPTQRRADSLAAHTH